METPKCSNIRLKDLIAIVLTIFLLLHTLLSSTHFTTHILHLLTINPLITLSCAWCVLLSIFYYYYSRPHPVLLLNYTCYKPPSSQKGTYEASADFVRRTKGFTPESQDFMRRIYLNSGIGDETYVPKFVFETKYESKLEASADEARQGVISAVDSLLSKTNIHTSLIDSLIINCGSFSPVPSISSIVVNHFKLKPTVKTYNLSGMGCGSGVIAIHTAAKLLQSSRKLSLALVVITENISSNWYFGNNRSMLVSNCIFRVGAAAALMTNDPSCRRVAKMEIVNSLRTHHGADDPSYLAAFQEEDENGAIGVSLTKDLTRVAGTNLQDHIRILAPRVLPVSQLALHGYHAIVSVLSLGESKPQRVPDFKTAFDHFCIHTGGKAVIQQVERVMGLGDEVTEPARMTLHRFGNTSSSSVLYELAYFEAKGRVRKGDRMWMVGFGTGFKICSLVWKSLSDLNLESDNPWSDCIHRYPLKSW
ncbi:hypothetical protein FNV43_RR12569 [Rhamnella rubrinervis]|uniref:3-ketoacyl-CoA synthase n=1 Tax=Rhamnella rubrinervis TaxID=2594499 RepID=A0A8K0MIX8_9ROSA|nr:hypothetical protein FNV43_RR12569 [Rhamnella rubrinervis]